MNKADTTLLINKELTRIGIPLEHEHAMYFRDGYLFAQKQALTLPVTEIERARESIKEYRDTAKNKQTKNFCESCGNKLQFIVETDINSKKVCKSALCKAERLDSSSR